MVYVGVDVRGKSLGASAGNERKPRVLAGEQPASRAWLRALLQVGGTGGTRVVFEAGHPRK